VNHKALLEMHRQVGVLQLDDNGVAQRGLLVRHLVLPEGLAGTAEAMRFLADELSPDTYVNIMDQYYPAFRASEYPPLDRRTTQIRSFERRCRPPSMPDYTGSTGAARSWPKES